MINVLIFLLVVAVAACICLALIWRKSRSAMRQIEVDADHHRAAAEVRQQELQAEIGRRQKQIERLAKWEKVDNAVEKARQLLGSAEAKLAAAESDARATAAKAQREAEQMLEEARSEASKATSEGRANAKRLTEESRSVLTSATEKAAQIITDANQKAKEIAGEAYDALRNADLYERTVKAMKNIIKGYGDEYLKPAASLLDELAEDFGHKDAGRNLKLARDHTKTMINSGQASRCDYVESSRREGAERFVLDAFNGKVDSILSRVRHDNYGTLEQEIRPGPFRPIAFSCRLRESADG